MQNVDALHGVNVQGCRVRQGRLVDFMHRESLDFAVLVTREHIEYLLGPRWDFRFEPVAVVDSSGKALIVCPDRAPESVAADDVRTYVEKWRSTLRYDQRKASSLVLADWLIDRSQTKRIGVEFSSFPEHLSRLFENVERVDLEPFLLQCRRRKDPDERARLQVAIDATGRMYEVARSIVEPGITELEVFSKLQQAAVGICGEPLTETGNDYACGVRGGPARSRRCESGELYILDLGPAFQGYFADNARTLSVDRQPTDEQFTAWKYVTSALTIVERIGRAGVSCREIYQEVFDWLRTAPVGTWSSHLGHGIGLFPHETPHLNPSWDDRLENGDVIAVEPALYAPSLKCGMRIENDYLVTETGLELLSPFPLGLVEEVTP